MRSLALLFHDSEPFVVERVDECAVEMGTLPQCNCPFEHWHVNGVCVDIHIEEEGYTHATMDSGDFFDEVVFTELTDISIARTQTFAWVRHKFDPAMRDYFYTTGEST